MKRNRACCYTIVSLAAMAILAGLLAGCAKPSPVVLPEAMDKVEYALSDSDTCMIRRYTDHVTNTPIDIDLYSTGADQLRSLDLNGYKKFFGPMNDAETAAKAAAIVHNDIYQNACAKLIVGFNKTADAWIIREDTKAPLGTGTFAILKESGRVIMVFHLIE